MVQRDPQRRRQTQRIRHTDTGIQFLLTGKRKSKSHRRRMPLRQRVRIIRKASRYRRARSVLAKKFSERLRLWWAIANLSDLNSTDVRFRDDLIEMSKEFASNEVRADRLKERLRDYSFGFIGVILMILLAAVVVPEAAVGFPIAHGYRFFETIVRSMTALVCFLTVILATKSVMAADTLLRGLALPRSVFVFGLTTFAIACVAPAVCVLFCWWASPHLAVIDGAIDGSFIGGFASLWPLL